MSSDTSLIFNIVAKDKASAALQRFRDRVDAAAPAIGAGVAAGLGAGLVAEMDASAASDKLAAQLGVGPAEAAELSRVSAAVYTSAWGDSTATVNEAIRGVYQQIGDTSGAEGGLEGLTTKALALAETFDQDVNGATAAVGQMLRTGLAEDADQAFDILTRGFQTGADKAGDLLDTFNEYSTQFRQLGLDGETAMGLLSQGLSAGARDADLVADALKEGTIRLQELSADAAGALDDIGLSATEIQSAIAAGGPGAADALDQVLDGLRGVADESEQSQLAVALFGTQAEDLQDALYALDPSAAVAALGEIEGATNRVAETVADPSRALEQFKRTALTRLGEIAGGFVQWAMANQQVMLPLAGALAGIAATILLVRVGTAAWAAAQGIATAATMVWTGAQWLLNAAFWASPITWIIAGIIALVAVIVLIATKTTWFQTAWNTSWGAIKGAAQGAWRWIKDNWPLILTILTGPIGAAVWIIKEHGDSIVGFFRDMPGRISRAASGMWNGITSGFKGAVNGIIRGWNNLSFTVGGGSFMGVGIPSFTLGTPNIPYLAQGGLISRAGAAVVGERGPELLSLPGGAQVTPLSRGRGPDGGAQRVVVEFRFDGPEEMVRLMRKAVRVRGGNVQVVLGKG